MPKQPMLRVRDYVVEFFKSGDETSMKQFFLLFGPQGYGIQLIKVDDSRILLIACKHTETK